jgi:hypothetical protein
MNANIIKNVFAFLLVISAGVVSAAQGDVFTWTGARKTIIGPIRTTGPRARFPMG